MDQAREPAGQGPLGGQTFAVVGSGYMGGGIAQLQDVSAVRSHPASHDLHRICLRDGAGRWIGSQGA